MFLNNHETFVHYIKKNKSLYKIYFHHAFLKVKPICYIELDEASKHWDKICGSKLH